MIKKIMSKSMILVFVLLCISFVMIGYNVNAKEYSAAIAIDFPTASTRNLKQLKISGWVMSNYSNAKVEVSVDGTILPNNETNEPNKTGVVTRTKRNDVIQAIKGYGSASENPTPGFTALVDISDKSTHEVKVRVLDNENKDLTEPKVVSFRGGMPATATSFDGPKENSEAKNGKLDIFGWVMSESDNSSVKIKVDGTEVPVSRVKRSDVIQAIKGYGSANENPTPGFTATIDVNKYNLSYDRKHDVTLEVYEGNQLLKSEVRHVIVPKPATAIAIDTPTTSTKNTNQLKISGWVMSSYSNAILEVSVNGNVLPAESVTRTKRNDVIQAIKGYGTADQNPTPGFTAVADISSLPNKKKYEVKVRVLDKNKVELVSPKTVYFTKDTPKTAISFDGPKENTKVENGKLDIFGWVMSESDNSSVKIKIDGTEVPANKISRTGRSDVIKAIKGYGSANENPTPGFSTTVDVNNLSYGNHKVVIEVYEGNVLLYKSSERHFTISKPKYTYNIESPASDNTVKKTAYFHGWVMSKSNINVEMYIDDDSHKVEVKKKARNDVIKAIKGYGTVKENPTPEFGNDKVDLSGFDDGEHKLIVKFLDSSNRLLETVERKFKLDKYTTKYNITSPSADSTQKLSMNVTGSVTTDAPAGYSVEVYLDKLQEDKKIHTSSTSSINFTHGNQDLSDGKHILIFVLRLSNGKLSSQHSVEFNVKKYDGAISLDNPSDQKTQVYNDGSLEIYGWAVSEDINDDLKIYVDGKSYGERNPNRDGIFGVMGKDFAGGKSVNPNTGFEAVVKGLPNGNHTIVVELKNHMNEIIDRKELTIYLCTDKKYGIDVSRHQGTNLGLSYAPNIQWYKVKDTKDFAIIRAGYTSNEIGKFSLVKDQLFADHAKDALAAGLEVGVYWYSQARDYLEGTKEAAETVKQLDLVPALKVKGPIPIVIDVEDAGAGTRAHPSVLSKQARTDGIRGFIDHMHVAGYDVMIYANKNYLTNYIDLNQIKKISPYKDIWLAHYVEGAPDVTSNYNLENYSFWQYSSTGRVNGVNGNVDLDIWYLGK